MADFKDEQKNEIEALESIYPNELEVLVTEPYHVFTVTMQSEVSTDMPLSLVLKFTYVPNYPEEGPLVEVINTLNVKEDDTEMLMKILRSEIEDNLGMAMIFTLVSAANEWLNSYSENVKARKTEEEILKKKITEEEERKRFEGTKVTIESFLSWKAKFDAEMTEIKSRQKDVISSKKLTGKELFAKDKNLVDSDLQFLQEGEDDIKVDESLFQELDDLDLEEVEEQDENQDNIFI